MYIEAQSGSDLMDRFAVNITGIPGSTMIEGETHSGIFGQAEISISYNLACTENYYGPRCEQLCLSGSCPCDPGFTGQFCATSIDDCDSVSCGENQMCIDGHLNYTCTCLPGYTGQDCSTDTNEPDVCADVSCGENRVCVRGGDTSDYTCACDSGLTGENCVTASDMCEGVDCGDGICAPVTIDERNTITCVCDSGFGDREYCYGNTTPTVVIIIISTIVTFAVLFLVACIIVVVCLIRCIKMRRKFKNSDDLAQNTEITVTSPSSTTTTTMTTPFFEQSDYYDYPTVPIAREGNIAPRPYETNVDCGPNPSYGIRGTIPVRLDQETGEDEDHYYY